MINNSEFSNRLRTIMEFYQLSASAFADKIQVPRSSISHLLSGRNKPSLDFVLKVVKEFEDVELYWLLNGKGSFPNSLAPIQTSGTTASIQENSPKAKSSANNDFKLPETAKKIERIVIFFDDGTFKEYLK